MQFRYNPVNASIEQLEVELEVVNAIHKSLRLMDELGAIVSGSRYVSFCAEAMLQEFSKAFKLNFRRLQNLLYEESPLYRDAIDN